MTTNKLSAGDLMFALSKLLETNGTADVIAALADAADACADHESGNAAERGYRNGSKHLRIVWLSTTTMLLACGSIAQAVALGAPGDSIHTHDDAARMPAALASHKIMATRTGRKHAVKVTR